jgi:hypothetical protein
MATKMPGGAIPTPRRGAIPTPRSEFAASDRYRPEAAPEVFVPSGEFPTPNHELASAQPYKACGPTPESFIAWPIGIDSWGNETVSDSGWAEEAFAKACAEPKVLIPSDVVLLTSRECGSSNFAAFMQTHGFQLDGKAYLDGPFNSVDWTDAAALNGAIANVGPVKIGVATANLGSGPRGQVTPGTSGWAVHDLPTGQPENQWASLCGYGPLSALIDLFERHGGNVRVPSGMPAGLCYAMFIRGSIGVVDRQSLMNITGEAWIRDPTTIVRNLGE